MYSPSVAKTSNVINKYLGIFDNKIDLYNLFVSSFPKVPPKRILYFKKVKKQIEEDVNVSLLAKSHELSRREINDYLALLK